MQRSAIPQAETFTFRLDPKLKAALADAASEARLAPGAYLRAVVRAHLDDKVRSAFEAEARRQSALIASSASNPASDEAVVLRELAEAIDAEPFAESWKA